jgi:hypothetical protein
VKGYIIMASLWEKLKNSNRPAGMSEDDYKKMQQDMRGYKKFTYLLTALTFICMVSTILTLIIYPPMRIWENGILVVILTAPLTLFITHKLMQMLVATLPTPTSNSTTPTHAGFIQNDDGVFSTLFGIRKIMERITDPRIRKNLPGIILLLVPSIAGMLSSSVFIINHTLDHSTAKTYTMPIESKYISSGKHGSRYYKIRFLSPVPSVLPFEFDTHEVHQTSLDNYNRVIIGQTTLTIQVHDGALGMPWYDNRLSSGELSNLAPQANMPQH